MSPDAFLAFPLRGLCLGLAMTRVITALFVFLGGFAVMVLEIIGARFLAKDFGGSFYVWISQIGVILVALAAGYAIGGALADRFRRAGFLAVPLLVAAVFIYLIPQFTPKLLEAIVMRHPAGEPIPVLWVKLDPALGSGLVFFLPCFVLAVISPYTIRIASSRLETVGMVSGLVYSASTVGSIAGVFMSGYFFIDYMSVSTIFKATGVLTFFLAVLSVMIDRRLRAAVQKKTEASSPSA